MAKHSIENLRQEACAKGLRGQQVNTYIHGAITAESNRREAAARRAEEGR